MDPKEENVSFENGLGEKLQGILHLPPKSTQKALILCHGFGSSKDFALLWHIADGAAQQGIAALRFDFSGCGTSEGSFADSNYTKQMGDLKSAIEMMKKRGHTPIALCGHSMGGAVSLLVGTKEPEIKAIVDLAAPSHPNRDMVKKFGINVEDGSTSFTLGNKNFKLSKKFVEDLEHIKVDDAVRKLKIPLLFVHGTADTIVPYSQSEHLHLLNTGEDNTLEPVEGADHLFSGQHEAVAGIVMEWLVKRI